MSRDTAPANPAGLPTDEDRILAASFRELDRFISDLRGAAAVLELVEDDTIMRADEMGEIVRSKAGLPPDFEVHVLTEAQGDALRYATFHLRKTVEQLCDQYRADLCRAHPERA